MEITVQISYLALEDISCGMKLLKLKILVFAIIFSDDKRTFP